MGKSARYEGRIYFRPANRGLCLDELPDMPHIEEWLSQQLSGKDLTYLGGQLRVRLTVELLEVDSEPSG